MGDIGDSDIEGDYFIFFKYLLGESDFCHGGSGEGAELPEEEDDEAVDGETRRHPFAFFS